MNPFLLAGGLVLAALYFRDASKQKRYVTGLRFRIHAAKIENAKLVLTMIVSNPNSQPAVVRSFYGEVYVNAIKIGRVELNKEFTVLPNAENSFDTAVAFKLPNSIKAGLDLAKGVAGSVITLTGNANVNGTVMPLKVQYRVQ